MLLQTSRLLLRRWTNADCEPFAAINSDPRVLEFLPRALSRDESDSLIERIEEHFERHGFGLWAVEVPDIAPLIGFVGLSTPKFEAHFTPCVEIGWRLSADYWGCGYATEAARAALDFAFNSAKLDEVVSFTVPDNRRSRAVMERLGMRRNPADDFDHPKLPAGDRLRPHMFYRIGREDYSPERICM